MTFELFDNPEQIACCDDDYIEYDEHGMEKIKMLILFYLKKLTHRIQTMTV